MKNKDKPIPILTDIKVKHKCSTFFRVWLATCYLGCNILCVVDQVLSSTSYISLLDVASPFSIFEPPMKNLNH